MSFLKVFKKPKANKHARGEFSDLVPSVAGVPIAGYVDDVSSDCISGWCMDLSNPRAIPELELVVADEVLASTQPHLTREDIPRKPGQDVKAGFKLHIGKELAANILETESKKSESGDPSTFILFQIRVSGHNAFLPATPGVELRLVRQDIEHLARGEYFNIRDPFRARFERLKEAAVGDARFGVKPQETKLIAFYLPQFHPFPENSEWWGEGFTDWTNVATAESLFPEHYQPHLPADLGFYDLRLAEVRERQADLAREYGIHGFCYHYYWFAGRTLMDMPIRAMLESGRPDFPFCICWANEPWTRRWDGSENEVLLAQPHELNADERFILDILPFLKDERYIRVNGAPLIIIYRVSLLPDAPELFRRWRVIAGSHGISDLHIVMAETFGLEYPHKFGCDAAVEFHPHRLAVPEISEKVFDAEHKERFKGAVFDYRDVVRKEMLKTSPGYVLYRGIIPCWDNTPRRGPAGHVFHNSSPEYYEIWLRNLVDYTEKNLPPGRRLIFINAWNEWAEGAHLEPDRKYGRRYLESTRQVISDRASAESVLLELELAHNGDKTIERAVETLRNELRGLKQANRFMAEQHISAHYFYILKHSQWVKARSLNNRVIQWDSDDLIFFVERVNQYSGNDVRSEITLDRYESLELIGWLFVKGFRDPGIHSYLYAHGANDEDLIVPIRHRFDRADVKETFPHHVQMLAGFEVIVPCTDVSPGLYDLSFVVTNGDLWKGKQFPLQVRII